MTTICVIRMTDNYFKFPLQDCIMKNAEGMGLNLGYTPLFND